MRTDIDEKTIKQPDTDDRGGNNRQRGQISTAKTSDWYHTYRNLFFCLGYASAACSSSNTTSCSGMTFTKGNTAAADGKVTYQKLRYVMLFVS
jgi:hypothetical protein